MKPSVRIKNVRSGTTRRTRRTACALLIPLTILWVQVAGIVTAAESIAYSIDRLGRVSKAVYSTGIEVTYVYDLLGNRVQKIVSGAVTDTDGDGISDAWMIQHFGHPTGQTNDLSRAGDDADGDRMNNLKEFIAGTDPTDPDSVLRVRNPKPEGPGVSVTWQSVPGKKYRVLFRENLAEAAWIELAAEITATAEETTYQNASPIVLATGFFRIEVIPSQ